MAELHYTLLTNNPLTFSWQDNFYHFADLSNTCPELLSMHSSDDRDYNDRYHFNFLCPVEFLALTVDEFRCYFERFGYLTLAGEYYSHIYFDRCGFNSLEQLADHCQQYAAANHITLSIEQRSGRLHIRFEQTEFRFSCYETKSRPCFSVFVETFTDKTPLLNSDAYNELLEVSGYLVFSGKDIHVNKEYHSLPEVQYCPTKIKQRFADNAVIWLDIKNDKLGFSARTAPDSNDKNDYALIVNFSEATAFFIQNYDQARGPESSELWVELKGRTKAIFCLSKIHSNDYFNAFVTEISQLTRIPITLKPSYSNC